MNSENGIARFRAENRYDAMYPSVRAVPQSTLHIIKRLRAAGVGTVIEPEDERPLCFTFQRGAGEWLADPAIILLAAIPVNIASSIIYSWWNDRKRRDREFPSATAAFVVERDGETYFYGLDGKRLSRAKARALAARAERSAASFRRSLSTPTPDPSRRYPIQRDHSGEVVGWFARLHEDDDGSLKLVDPRIVDRKTRADIASGKLAGMSVGAIAQRSICSVCRGNYVDCDHVAGDEYESGHCVVFIEESLPAEFSFVQDPINPATKLLVR
jgi:hypothetical protein